MTAEKISQCMADAKDFAHKYRPGKEFIGYTENEVIKGFSVFFMLIDEVVSASDESRELPRIGCAEQISDILGLEGDEVNRAFEVAKIAIGMLKSQKPQEAIL